MGESSGEGEIRLHLVLEALQGGNQKQRIEGLKDLKAIFDRPHKASNLEVLTDKAYHKIYEVIFKLALSEKQAFLVVKKNTRTAALTRLTACADVVRVVVKAGAPKLKGKTVDAVLDHITQTVSKADGGYYEPLVQHYLKALSGVFEHQPNVEHLKPERWVDTVDFCLQGINQYLDENYGEPSGLSRSFSGLYSGSMARPASGNGYTQNHSGSLSRQNAEDLLQTLSSLVSASNAPIPLRYQAVADSIMRFLQLQGTSVNQVHQLAFSIINTVLTFTRIHQTSFTRSIAEDAVPIICRFLQGKAVAKDEMLNSVRDEMLILLFYVHPHLERGVEDEDIPDLLSKLEDLADVLGSDYAKRSEKDQLQLDDLEMIDFGGKAVDTHPFNLQNFRLRPHNLRGERNWAHLQAIGILERLVRLGNQKKNHVADADDNDLDKHPRKRQRIIRSPDRLLDQLASEDEKVRASSLHSLSFVLQGCQLSTTELSALLSQLHVCASDKRGKIAAWALLAIASCTNQLAVTELSSLDFMQLWHIGVRSMTLSLTCRTASLLIHALLIKKLVQYQEVAEDVNVIITAADSNGPVVLCDSAIFLMIHLLHARVTEVPGASLVASHHVIRWLFAKWNPDDRFFAAHYAIHVQPDYFMPLLRTCLGLNRMSMTSKTTLPCGPVAQAWQHHLNSQGVIRYLLLLKDIGISINASPSQPCPEILESGTIVYILDTTHFQSSRKLILELLFPKCRGLLQNWKNYTVDRSSALSTDTFRTAISSCVIMLLAMPHFANATLTQLNDFKMDLQDLSKELVSFLADSEVRDTKGAQPLIEAALQTVEPYLPQCGSDDFSQLSQKCSHLLRLFVILAEDCDRRRLAITFSAPGANDDPMDLDDDFSTQQSHTKVEGQRNILPRLDLALEKDAASFYLVISGRLMLLEAMNATPELTGFLPSSFIDYLLSLSDEEFLSNRPLLREILRSDLILETEDASKLIRHLGSRMLSSNNFDRCEVALGLCLDVLCGLGSLWSSPDSILDIAEPASEIYQWFIEVALDRDIVSPEVQKSIARLLLLLLQIEPEYGVTLSIPSVRSSLFGILQKGNAVVKFCIGDHLPNVFGHFLLKDHDDVFVDVLERLPSDPEWMEGISFRLFVLANLASRWSNLLRRCIYHIFEAPGRIGENAIKHATKALENVSRALDVEGPRGLFALFAPQLLFTWLDSQPIEHLPFQIFGFSCLKDLLLDAQEEVTGLMIMRGQDEGFETIAQILGLDESSLLEKSFSKVMAYSIARDLSTPPSSSRKKQASGEARVKKILGKELFFSCINLHFTDIVALLFNIVDQEVMVEKYLEKRQEYVPAANILREMKGISSSNISLPPNQQPFFSGKYLTAEIMHLCSRTIHEAPTLFTPALVTSVARKLLNTIQPALGSLHTCSVLRKLRVLISLAGDSAIEGYPLEMLLQSTQTLVTDPECADDVFGVMQYLLSHGSLYLSQNPSFVAGLALSILGSLRTFLKSSQSSTTQESQFRTTMSKAQTFHKWFGKYLDDYESPALKTKSKGNFQNLVKSAFDTQSVGNADVGSSESHLLFQLLKDEQSGGNLLNRPSRELALSMLCSEFRIPVSFRDDILGDDDLAIANAAVVWKSCRGESASQHYLAWAARVLGRAFVASGHIHHELLQESNLTNFKMLSMSSDSEAESKACLLNILQELTWGHDLKTVGLAESALRVIMAASDQTILETCQKVLAASLYDASIWSPYETPPSESLDHGDDESTNDPLEKQAISRENWLRDLTIGLAQSIPDDRLLHALIPILQRVSGFPDRVFPLILHLVLSAQSQNQEFSKKRLSKSFIEWLGMSEAVHRNSLKILLNAILYLRTQPLRNEKSSADRSNWLDIDYIKAATAATHCGMHKTALLFVEEFCSEPVKTSRRSSIAAEQQTIPTEILLTIFQNIDDPDMYYGVQQKANLSTILSRFEYEKDGPKSLAFRGAQYDSHVRRGDTQSSQDIQSLVKALDVLSLSGLSHSLLQSQQTPGMTATSLDSMFHTARKLEQWDIPVPRTHNSNAVTIYRAFQTINTTMDYNSICEALNEGLESTMRSLVKEDLSASALHDSLRTLGALVEMDEVLSSKGSKQFEDMLGRFQNRAKWMKIGRFDDISQIISCRGTTLSTLSQQSRIQAIMKVPVIDTRLVEVRTALLASRLNRAHGALQESLSLATSMMDLIIPCIAVGLNVEAAIHVESANALWDQGEMTSSIGMLQALDNGLYLKGQATHVAVGRSDLLSRIGHQVSVARLEKADKIIDNYLKPALKELKGETDGSEAGQVFHQFAVFCDQQLQDPDGLEDLERLKKLRRMKKDEVKEYDKLISTSSSSTEKSKYRNYQVKAKTWLKLDEEELHRHNASRDEFLRQCFENYLLALIASDDHDSNALRFSALWLEHSEDKLANDVVSKHLSQVPSRKLAPLMNQLTSRLQDTTVKFQQLLYALILRICTEHPYHGMYQIYSAANSKPNSKDETAGLRNKATRKLTKQLANLEGAGEIWASIFHTNQAYCQLAAEKDDRYKTGKRVAFKESPSAVRLASLLAKYHIPPPTMRIGLATNLDYSKIPKMMKFDSTISIASGVSAPKIITAVADNGKKFKQLVKGGNDDLRQDAIMEQVFEQVSELLKTNRSTRQRNLSIRTYKVLPLTSIAGVIEFVPNTIPLHEYLMPAHERYYPKDLKGNQCRKEIGDVQSQSVDTRVRKFRTVTERFHPVMKYFFTEKFTDPDEWFVRRLAYTRSTAAISILGHVLGLGDRHGHNILLDAKSGEVVHIDLGVAFEMGRVLPVPELVPFRLTRDIVDGMGITKTEGVFRRCCEFTLEALRKEAYSIMSILDVLRYDPLYSWSISPVRLAKLQEGQSAAPEAVEAGGVNERKEAVNEPGEADRALTVVNKKLSKTLSVTATVNDLINQASDERNLAVLYSGWAAYA